MAPVPRVHVRTAFKFMSWFKRVLEASCSRGKGSQAPSHVYTSIYCQTFVGTHVHPPQLLVNMIVEFFLIVVHIQHPPPSDALHTMHLHALSAYFGRMASTTATAIATCPNPLRVQGASLYPSLYHLAIGYNINNHCSSAQGWTQPLDNQMMRPSNARATVVTLHDTMK